RAGAHDELAAAHSPNIVAAAAYCQQPVASVVVRTCHVRPYAPVPMQRQRVINVVIPTMKAYRPDVVAAAAYCKKSVVICVRIRAWHHGPRASVPMEHQRLRGDEAAVELPDTKIVVAAACSYDESILCASDRTCEYR